MGDRGREQDRGEREGRPWYLSVTQPHALRTRVSEREIPYDSRYDEKVCGNQVPLERRKQRKGDSCVDSLQRVTGFLGSRFPSRTYLFVWNHDDNSLMIVGSHYPTSGRNGRARIPSCSSTCSVAIHSFFGHHSAQHKGRHERRNCK